VVSKIGICWVSMRIARKKRKRKERYLKRMHRPHRKKYLKRLQRLRKKKARADGTTVLINRSEIL
jgi:hypothetical protein